MTFDQGAVVRLKATFKDYTGVLADPTTVTFNYKLTASGFFTYIYGTGGIVKESTGVYHLDVATASDSGVCEWRIRGTAPAPGAKQGTFYINPADPVS